jgi:hypothetical protein
MLAGPSLLWRSGRPEQDSKWAACRYTGPVGKRGREPKFVEAIAGIWTYVGRLPDHVVDVADVPALDGLVRGVTMSQETYLILVNDRDARDWYFDNARSWPLGRRDLRDDVVYRNAWDAPLTDQDGFDPDEAQAKAETAAILAQMHPETRRLLEEVEALLRR